LNRPASNFEKSYREKPGDRYSANAFFSAAAASAMAEFIERERICPDGAARDDLHFA